MSKIQSSFMKKVPFAHLCKMMDLCMKTKNNNRKQSLIRMFFDPYIQKTDEIYPVVRILFPELDEKRIYGIKETTLSRLLLKTYSISSDSYDGKRLIECQQGSEGFYSLLHSVALSRHPKGSQKDKFTLWDVNVFLKKMLSSKTKDEKLRLLQTTISKLQASCFVWLMKVMLKNIDHNIGFKIFCNILHPEAHLFYMHQANLEKMCSFVIEKKHHLNEEEFKDIHIEMFVPFRPMLCGRRDIRNSEDIQKNMNAPYLIETKYDGERALVHVQNRKMRIFSRNLQDVTSNYQSLLLHIRKSLSKDVKSVILDGEIVVWNEKTNSIEPFGKQKEVILRNANNHRWFFFQVFDIIHLNGSDLLHTPLFKRKKLLSKSIDNVQHHVKKVSYLDNVNSDEILDILSKQVQDKQEGIVVKNPRSPYLLNKRDPKAWLKLKPEYMYKIVHDLDMVILGANYGGPRYNRSLYSYLVGVKNTLEGQDVFHPIGNVSTGLNNEERSLLLKELEEDWVDEKPLNVFDSGYDKPNVWIDPNVSIILQIQAMEIIPSTKRNTGVTLRCPRIEKIRFDKDAETIISLKELRQHIRSKEMSQIHSVKKSQTKEKRVPIPLTLPTYTDDLEILSDKFQGLTFYVHGFVWEPTFRKKIESTIYQHGGHFVQNYCYDVDIILYAKDNDRVQALRDKVQKVQEWIDMDLSYDKLKILRVANELKPMLRERKCKLIGKKQDLIQRILDFDSKLKPQKIYPSSWLDNK